IGGRRRHRTSRALEVTPMASRSARLSWPSGRPAFVLLSLTVSLAVTPARPADAATWFVNGSNGSCSNAHGGSSARPYCSISAAVGAHHGPGDTILVEPGVYREQITIDGSGDSDAPLTLEAKAPGVVVEGADDFSNPAL